MIKSLSRRLAQSRAAKGALVVGVTMLAGSAFADSTAAVAAITAAQTDAVAVAGAFVTMGVAVWGALYLYRKFFR
jgi:hypothetical protein